MNSLYGSQKPIINSHAHIFTAKHVPPFLAKGIIAWPFYYLLETSFVIKLFIWNKKRKQTKFTARYIRNRRARIKNRIKRKNNVLYQLLSRIIDALFLVSSLVILCLWILPKASVLYEILSRVEVLYERLPLSVKHSKTVLFGVGLVASKSLRKILFFALKRVKLIVVGKGTAELIQKYKSLVNYSMYEEQHRIFEAMRRQYPADTKFVILPMDMEFMEAGKLSKVHNYKSQMEELRDIKTRSRYGDVLHPFVFADPRRITQEADHFVYHQAQDGSIVLDNCFIKSYVEEYGFQGFKIYPALGYFPFDEQLLPLWKYAADHQLPIMTHCIKGTVFYRGPKKASWYEHPVFKEYASALEDEETYQELLLPNEKNIDFQTDFTHPLNYLVLLDELLLRMWVGKCSLATQALFGYTNEQTKLRYDLSHLKICFAHFGGDDQWSTYLQRDFAYDVKTSDFGVQLTHTIEQEFSWRKIERHWKHTDWYTLICSMMLQYENVYADISYILHKPDIYGLLKQTLKNKLLKNKVLFGTDFYVVRNHNTEKGLRLLAQEKLSKEDFDRIARYNPVEYLKNNSSFNSTV